MSNRMTRRQLVQRGAAGATILSLPGLLAACGGGGDGGGGGGELADVLEFANWPLYIDVDEQTKKRPTLEQFTADTGIRVNYYEEISAMTGVGISALKMRVKRACDRLRAMLEDVERV